MASFTFPCVFAPMCEIIGGGLQIEAGALILTQRRKVAKEKKAFKKFSVSRLCVFALNSSVFDACINITLRLYFSLNETF